MAPRLLAALKKNYPDYLKMLDDRETVRLIQSYARRVEGKFEDLVVLGIGGSALGAVCLDTALRPLFSDRTMARRGRWPRLTVLDNIDPDLLADFEQTIDLSKTLFVVISKSGATPETQAQFLYFQKKMAARLADWHRNFVFVTDPGTGWLRHLAGHLAREKRPIVTFDIPPGVGGRFSVLSAVGLLPAAMTGIRIEQLLSGAKTARRQILQSRLSANPALSLAAVQYLLNRKGRSQQVFYVYAQKLRYLADWYRQLLAESIGKAVNRRGQKVQAGLTPVSALGVTDQHSQNQLYLEGPDDKIFLLVDVARPARRLSIPWRAAWSSLERPGALDYLRGVTFGRLLRAERLGTEQALVARQRPVISLTLDKLDARALGEVFVLLEASVSFLGELLNLDAYDQPGVELAKKLTRQILKNGR
jgi:glucose-6-phosphate isomerase